MPNEKVKFAFFGTSDFSVRILDVLRQNGLVPNLIVTAPDKPQGRKKELIPSPAKVWTRENNIDFIQPPSLKKLEGDSPLKNISYDLFLVASYGKIIPHGIIDAPKHGTINVHPSLLPKYRGPSPIQSFILSGEEETGVTIMQMDEEVDHGPIIKISNLIRRGGQITNLNFKQLEEKLAKLGGEMLADIIPDWVKGKIKPQAQDHSKATFTKKITKEDGLVRLEDAPEIIDRKFRAFYLWPGVYFFVEKSGKKIRVIITEMKTKNGELIIKRVKPEGKNEMPYEDFLRGCKTKSGTL